MSNEGTCRTWDCKEFSAEDPPTSRVWKKRVDNFALGEGVLPASFKVLYDYDQEKETLLVDLVPVQLEEWRLLIQVSGG
jgi:hypothetical protein